MLLVLLLKLRLKRDLPPVVRMHLHNKQLLQARMRQPLGLLRRPRHRQQGPLLDHHQPPDRDQELRNHRHRRRQHRLHLNIVSSFFESKNRDANQTFLAPGDRSHIPSNAAPIYEILSNDMQRVKSRAPASFKAQVDDAERRLNILFDHLNNEDLLKPNTIADMVELSKAIQGRDYETAKNIHLDILTNRTDECGNWMVS